MSKNKLELDENLIVSFKKLKIDKPEKLDAKNNDTNSNALVLYKQPVYLENVNLTNFLEIQRKQKEFLSRMDPQLIKSINYNQNDKVFEDFEKDKVQIYDDDQNFDNTSLMEVD